MGHSETQSAIMIRFVSDSPGHVCTPSDLQRTDLQAEEGNKLLNGMPDMLPVIQARNHSLFEDVVLAMFQTTLDGRLIAVNSAFVEMFRYGDPVQVRVCVQDIARDLFIRPEQSAETTELVLKQRIARGFEVPFRRKDGTVFEGNLHFWAVKDIEGRVLWLEGCIEDITERRATEDRLRYLCTHDALTGLHNRWSFEQEVERLGGDGQHPTSILVADIDELKLVNDRDGHIAGDQLLQRAARVLLEGCCGDDLVARTGGDEFAVLLPRADATMAESVVRRLRRDLACQNLKCGAPMLSLAFGVATAEPGETLIDTFQRADQQMYQDKARRSDTRQP